MTVEVSVDMKIMVGMHHPKQFWIFKNFILEGKKKGWKFIILVSHKDVIARLLDANGIEYIQFGSHKSTKRGQSFEALVYVFKTLRYSIKYKPDVFLGRCFPHFGISSKLMRRPFYVVEDSAGSNALRRIHKFTLPMIKKIFTPTSYNSDFKEKQIRVPSYDELLYLHPKRFTPDKNILKKYGYESIDKYAILRFVAWTAHHDFGESGIDLKTKRTIIDILKKHNYRVLISSEGKLEDEFAEYQIKIQPEDMHHILAYATIFIGDSQSMSSESAILGTSVIRSNSWVGTIDDEGNFKELEKKYDLMYNISKAEDVIIKLNELLETDDLKSKWLSKRKVMLKDKIDYTSFLLWYFENLNSKQLISIDEATFAKFK